MARKSTQSAKKEAESNSAAVTSEQIPANPIQDQAQVSAVVENHSRCGGALRAARERLGLSTQEIANRLRLSVKQIEALEADNFGILPEPTIVRGFIRNYCKQLKIEADPVLDAYNVIVPSKAPQSFKLNPTVATPVTAYEKPNAMRYVLIGVLAALGLAVWLFYQHYVQKPSPIEPTAALAPAQQEVLEQVQPDNVLPMPEAALPAGERAADEATTPLTLPPAGVDAVALPSTAPIDSSASAAAVTAPAAPAANSASALAPQPPAVAAPASVPAVSAVVEPAPASGMSKLEFAASQETWISVTDANGRQVFGKTLYVGNRETIQIKPPLNITVGNAGGTSLSVNGKTMDLAPYTRVNVAHIKVE